MVVNDLGIQFERPVGAPADVRELEYIAALHQTDGEKIRTNGTIQAKDIRNYLVSRHGVFLSSNTIEERIIGELAGTWMPEEEDDTAKPKLKKKKAPQHMDICQLTALLLVPYLRQEDTTEAKKPANALVQGMTEQVMNLVLTELHANGVDLKEFKAVDENFETGTRITSKLLRLVFDLYGEHSVPDEILGEMVEHAATEATPDEEMQDSTPRLITKQKFTEPRVFLNKATFQRALTADVQLYKPQWENLQTTHLEDAYSSNQTNRRGNKGDRVKYDDDFGTAPTVDQAADRYRSVTWMLLLWVSFLFFYGCYMFDSSFDVDFDSCSFDWGCEASSAIVNWLVVFGQFGIVGALYIGLGSLGNATYSAGGNKALEALGVIIAMGVVAASTIVPNFVQGQAFIWNSNKVDGYESVYWICFSLGIILICLQFIRLIDIFAPLGNLGAGGRTRSEQCTKAAATKKANVLVENAMMLHVHPIAAGEKPKPEAGPRFPARYASSEVVEAASHLHQELDECDELNKKVPASKGSERALRHYKEMENNLTETSGGILWAYQRLADGRLYDEEGVWFSARLITSVAVQLLVVAMLVAAYFIVLAEFKNNKENTVAVGSRRLFLEDALVQQRPSMEAIFSSLEARFASTQVQRIFGKQLHRNHRGVRDAGIRKLHRRLQFITPVNDTHYTDGTGVYPNIIYDVNRTHFTDGTTFWTHNLFSHNGTHVFDNYFRFNSTHFTDGIRYYPYSKYATNGTHITNGEYFFDGEMITQLSGNKVVSNIEIWEFKVALALGLVAAVFATIGIAIAYLPSFISTVLKFRSGVLESLNGEENFQRLRDGPSSVTTLLGSALWGAACTGLFCWLFVFGLVFLSVWSETRETALQIYALLLGLLAIFLLRLLVERVFRDLYNPSFYRKHPAAVNTINMVLECWNLAISILTMAGRAIKVSFVTLLYIGRIDTPLFAPGVGTIGPLVLDSEHLIFKKDLLIHEAHRHPYLERLGMMYLLKLRHGKEFGSRAGAYWRMLFVLALMPWMRDYRVNNNSKPTSGGSETDSDSESDEDIFDDEDIRRTDDNISVMSLHGIDLEIELTRRANEQLTLKNANLKEALNDLRARLRASNKKVAKLERKLGIPSERSQGRVDVPGPSSVGTPAKDPSASNATESFESESEEPSMSQESFTSDSGSGAGIV